MVARTKAVKPEEVEQAFWDLGKAKYETPGMCITCHQAGGGGAPNLAPPINGTKWVLGPVENLVSILTKGLRGEIEVKGEVWNMVMTPQVMLQTDEEIAAVLTYVRNSFGNQASVVTPEMVAEYRTPGTEMVTVADLIDPDLAPKAPPAERKLAPPVTATLPKAEGYTTFPFFGLAAIFLIVVAGSIAKFVFGKG